MTEIECMSKYFVAVFFLWILDTIGEHNLYVSFHQQFLSHFFRFMFIMSLVKGKINVGTFNIHIKVGMYMNIINCVTFPEYFAQRL